MRKLVAGFLIVATFGLLGAAPAFAGGGMGDPSAHLKEMNAICELQKRGQAPRNPDVCLPEYPPGPVEGGRGRSGN